MTRDEIVTALRCCTSSPSVWECKAKCAFYNGGDMGKCIPEMGSAAADLIEKLAADRKDLINELCQLCGKYKHAHEGAREGCKWRGM